MKFFKSSLVIVALLATSPMFAARSTTTAKPAAKGKAPAKGKTAVQPAGAAQAGQTYPQLIAFVKSAKDADVWDTNKNLLKDDFVTSMIYEALGADLEALQLDALLQTARDYHATFWNIQKSNIDLLQNLEAQRKEAINTFESRKLQQNIGGAL